MSEMTGGDVSGRVAPAKAQANTKPSSALIDQKWPAKQSQQAAFPDRKTFRYHAWEVLASTGSCLDPVGSYSYLIFGLYGPSLGSRNIC